MEGITDFAIVCQKLNVPFAAEQIVSGDETVCLQSWRDGNLVIYQNGQHMAVACPESDKLMNRLCLNAERLTAPRICKIARDNYERQEARAKRPSFW